MAKRKPKKSAAELDADIQTSLAGTKPPSLADRARARGFEPETEEGGRAMMQSLTFADVASMKPRGAILATGTPVTVEQHLVGGTIKLSGTVRWDNGRGNVDVKLTGSGRVVQTKKSPDGRLSFYG